MLEELVNRDLIAGVQWAVVAFCGDNYANIDTPAPGLCQLVDRAVIGEIGVLNEDVTLRVLNCCELCPVDL